MRRYADGESFEDRTLRHICGYVRHVTMRKTDFALFGERVALLEFYFNMLSRLQKGWLEFRIALASFIITPYASRRNTYRGR